jgi:hypothetical protein
MGQSRDGADRERPWVHGGSFCNILVQFKLKTSHRGYIIRESFRNILMKFNSIASNNLVTSSYPTAIFYRVLK